MATGYYRSTEDYRRRDRLSVQDLNRMTLNVVDRVKNDLKEKRRRGKGINQSEIEESTYTAKHDLNPEVFDSFEWKKAMPTDYKPVQQDTLVSAMAYANEIDDVIPIYREKLNNNSNQNSTNLSDALSTLKSAKRDLETKPKSSIWSIIRKMNKNEIQRANRLFYSEIQHWLPAFPVKMIDIEYVVEAIWDTTYEFEGIQQLLPLVKACSSYDDARGIIKTLEEETQKNILSQSGERSSSRTTMTTDVRSSPRQSSGSFRYDDRHTDETRYRREQDDYRGQRGSTRSTVPSRKSAYDDDEE